MEELERLRDQVKHEPPTKDSDDELTELKRRLILLEEGYEAQIAALKKQYEKSKSDQAEYCDDSVRQKYQIEVEQLRVKIVAFCIIDILNVSTNF